MIDKSQLCIVTNVHNKKYIKHFKDNLFKSYIKFKSDLPMLVCTNCIDELKEITKDYPLIKLFETDYLRDYDIKNFDNENLINSDKTEKTYNNYPFNIRRHIIRKGFEEGYSAVWALDSDVQLNWTDDVIIEKLNQYKIKNAIVVEGTVFAYSNKDLHLRAEAEKVFSDKNWGIDINDLVGYDGPSAFYIGEKDIFYNYIDMWSNMTAYSYENNTYAGRLPDSFPINLMFAIAIAGNIDIVNTGYIFSNPNHNPDDRYN